MKVVIDLIEDIRESIANDRRYEVVAGLLKRDPDDPHTKRRTYLLFVKAD